MVISVLAVTPESVALPLSAHADTNVAIACGQGADHARKTAEKSRCLPRGTVVAPTLPSI